MKNNISSWLILVDIIIPLALINLFSDSNLNYPAPYLFGASLFYIFSIIFYSLIMDKYSKYFFTHMDKKLRDAFYCWIFALFIQFIYFHFLDLKDQYSISINLLLIWILIPNLTFIVRFFMKNKIFFKKENHIEILILGNEYKFTSFEVQRLQEQNYSIRYAKDVAEVINEKFVNILVINKNKITVEHELLIKDKHNMISIYTISTFLEVFLRKLYIGESNITLLSQVKPFTSNQYFIKRCIDIISCFFIIPVLIILLPLFFLIIKIQSPGNIFFKQRRTTINNDEFIMYKFRTMIENKDDSNKSLEDMNRIYPFGRFLRMYRFDEIPQIINVIKGNMHIIGPRAEWDKLNDTYSSQIPFYKFRYSVKSGITGWAQVMFRYGHDSKDAKQKLMYDLYYIKNWSFWLDLEIGLRTFFVILRKRIF